jgi:hypothetical protein
MNNASVLLYRYFSFTPDGWQEIHGPMDLHRYYSCDDWTHILKLLVTVTRDCVANEFLSK